MNTVSSLLDKEWYERYKQHIQAQHPQLHLRRDQQLQPALQGLLLFLVRRAQKIAGRAGHPQMGRVRRQGKGARRQPGDPDRRRADPLPGPGRGLLQAAPHLLRHQRHHQGAARPLPGHDGGHIPLGRRGGREDPARPRHLLHLAEKLRGRSVHLLPLHHHPEADRQDRADHQKDRATRA